MAATPAAGPVDLHTHSTASDGTLAPARLVALAAARGLRVLALTDHDTTAGLAEAAAAAAEHGLRFVPGVELSTHVAAGEVHVLGYFIAPASPALADALARFRAAREGRARTIVANLAAAGAPVAYERVVELAGGATIGRPHVARALVEAGHAASVQDAFDRYLVRGRPGYVERYRLLPPDAVRLIREAGGVPVLAHPHSAADLDALLPDLLAAGLGGLECYYGDYDAAQRAALLALAARHDLVATGGTDFHGPGLAHGLPLGGVAVPLGCVDALAARRA
ncbi:MAG TPA: PHP domain-containing protein [Thermomicrobiales bacterium]|nr:PHP domain-containing protein [Thermomicrobiales bacterium]